MSVLSVQYGAQSSRRLISVLLGSALASLVEAAPTAPVIPPGAGQTLHDIEQGWPLPQKSPPPAPIDITPQTAPVAADVDARVVVTGVAVTGAKAFPIQELEGLLADATGQSLDFAGLEALAARITAFYQTHGYPAAFAFLPEQTLSEGRLRIEVMEGRFGAISILNDAVLRSSVLPLAGLQAGASIRGESLEHMMNLLSEIPGVKVNAGLKPGAEAGSSDLMIEILFGTRWQGQLYADNTGDPTTGTQHVGASITVNNLAGLGDQLSMQSMTSGRGLQYGRISWQSLVDASGSRAGLSASLLHYRLGGAFADLQGGGSARTVGLNASHPLLRSGALTLNLEASVENKQIQDRFDATDSITDKSAQVLNVGLSGQRTDNFGGGGETAFSLGLSAGHLAIKSPDAALTDEVSAHTAGQFGKMNLAFQRLQFLTPSLSLFLSASMQAASKNLDSSEKSALGGPNAVRAYRAGEASADDTRQFTVELRHFLMDGVQLTGFFDAAQGRVNHNIWTATDDGNRRILRGAGFAANWRSTNGFNATVTLARKLGMSGGSAASPRTQLWLQASMGF